MASVLKTSLARVKVLRVSSERLVNSVILGYQLITLFAFIAVPILAYQWLRMPFMGAFTEHSLLFNTTRTIGFEDSEIARLNLDLNQIIAIEDTPIQGDIGKLEAVLRNYSAGDQVRLNLHSPFTGEDRSVVLTLQQLSLSDTVTLLYIPYFIALIYLLSSVWVFGLRRQDATGRSFSIFTISVALSMVTLFDLYTTHRLTYLWTLGLAFCSGSLLELALLFPQQVQWVNRFPWLRRVGYITSLVLFVANLPTLYNAEHPTSYIGVWQSMYGTLGIAVLFFIGTLIYRHLRAESPVVREQAKSILLGTVFAFIWICGWFFTTIINSHIGFSAILLLPVIIFPIMTGITILRYRLLSTEYVINRSILYIIMAGVTIIGYGLLVSGPTLVLGNWFQIDNPFWIGTLAFLFAIGLYPLRNFLEQQIDNVFGRSQAAYQERLQTFGRDLTRVMELTDIVQLLRTTIEKNLMPLPLHIFIYDPLSDQYVAAPDRTTGKASSDLRFVGSNPLVQALTNRRTALFFVEGATIPMKLFAERSRLGLLGASLFVPFPGRKRLAGWIALGIRKSGEPYTTRDVEFLESLCDQAALAVERAQVISDLERRVHEMRVLTRVSQGINITLAFDDMLELIYAQTSQVIKVKDFRITLRDSYSQILYHVFYLDNDERLQEREQRPLPYGQGLEYEVIRSGRQIVTEDYERECRSRGTLPVIKGVYAWVSVPLNTGNESIGMVSMASREPTGIFTDEQVNLLQAISDQAAGAIVKGRLLQETERRARQLSTLNDVARSLTSTLELAPLLSQILQSSADILNCEAGSLLLVDSQTDELVFEVVIGPAAADLVGQRMAPNKGLVGKTVESRQPIIANDARRTKEWFEKNDEETGFTTKDLLVVPMLVKEKVLGVIEIINRKDGLPFTPGDQELLSAFTSQAAIAIENARLYTQTDQTLAARVEELSVMQRIDRELNAGLNVERAMRITLEWAMRQSKVSAGLIGVVEEPGIRIIASQGYTTELNPYAEAHIPIHLPGLKEAIETGQPQFWNQAAAGSRDGSNSLLMNCKSRIVVPIRRENQAIGVMLLENVQAEKTSDDVLSFISRLTDHAAIAIANAQLFAKVESANAAKVEFVKFVAHELKNPMSSIKGYTELVLSGVAGTVNDTQRKFLTTVRSNVDRMDTIVSDLNDATKIEGGKLALNFKTIQIKDVIDDVGRSLSRLIEGKKQTLNLQVPAELPMAWGDPVRIGQIITNLVSNAHKYTPENGIVTIGTELTVAETGASSVKMVHIWVQDTGIGISPEDQKQIFQQYFRTSMSKEMASGTGLGLNITKSLVEMQGGRIWFESEVRKGTTFHFTIPVAEAT